jgi:protein-L-isoaspartate(D-aspartate) O-methyltransferase
MMIQDNYRHKGLRKKLAEGIRDKGITNEEVLAAIEKIPRHLFLDPAFLEFAYQDQAFPIGSGQTISQPYTVAVQTELLDPQPRQKILEIGTGSGYQACVLLEMGVRVFSIERQRNLYNKTRKFLAELKYRPKLFFGDGYKGLPTFAPFDGIIITAGAPFIPEALKEQLKIGGKMIIPLGGENGQVMKVVLKTAENKFEITEHGGFSFVPMLEDKAND